METRQSWIHMSIFPVRLRLGHPPIGLPFVAAPISQSLHKPAMMRITPPFWKGCAITFRTVADAPCWLRLVPGQKPTTGRRTFCDGPQPLGSQPTTTPNYGVHMEVAGKQHRPVVANPPEEAALARVSSHSLSPSTFRK